MKNLYIVIAMLISGVAFGQIEQNINKTSGIESNPIKDIDSIRFNAGQTEMEIILNNGTILPHTLKDIDKVTFSGAVEGEIATLDCAGASINGTLVENDVASGVSAEIDYTGGNGYAHNGQTVSSTGVTGLTAELAAGNFATGAGTLTYDITGTPIASGTASFAIEIGGETCVLEVTVDAPQPVYPPGVVHCDEPTAVVEVTNPTTGKTWMDRNLGAKQVATSSTDEDAYGDTYQWGRGADGHQCRTSGTTSTLSNTDQPGHGDFIFGGGASNDWLSPQNNNLWQGVNGINNPCPIGFRLPTEAELDEESQSWSAIDPSGAFNSPLKLTAGGFRNYKSGVLFIDEGTTGYYWSSTVSTTKSIALRFSHASHPIYSPIRSIGFAVRCIKD